MDLNTDYLNSDFIGLGRPNMIPDESLPSFSSGYGLSPCSRARGSLSDLYGGKKKPKRSTSACSTASRRSTASRKSSTTSRKKKSLSNYQIYLKNTLQQVAKKFPKYTPQQKMDYVASLWRLEPNKKTTTCTVSLNSGSLGQSKKKKGKKGTGGDDMLDDY